MSEQLTLEGITNVEDLKLSVTKGIERALHNATERGTRKPPQIFHNAEQLKAVLRRTERILLALKKEKLVSDHDVELGTLAAAYYNFSRAKISTKQGTFLGYRTKPFLSAEAARSFMSNENKEAEAKFLSRIYSDEDMSRIERAILSTEAEWSPELKTMLHKCPIVHDPISSALALADVGVYGMEPESSLGEATLRYRENNPVFLSEFVREFAQRHVDFVKGRKTVFSSYELLRFRTRERSVVEKMFQGFDESIRIAEEFKNKVETASPEAVSKMMGY